MTDNLLETPERAAIEDFLRRSNGKPEEKPTYERVLGFLSGVVITPVRFMTSDWLQPLLDMNSIVFDDIDDANRFMGALMPLYNRVNALRLRDENVCPFELDKTAEAFDARERIVEWAIGFHSALTLRPDIWGAEKHEARHVSAELLEEAHAAIPFLWAMAEPQSIPEIVPDPVPFQLSLLKRVPGWTEDMQRETWDDELIDLFVLFCVGRLKETTEALQRYAEAYAKGTSTVSAIPPMLRKNAKVGRNERCPCGSGLKFKKCCGA
jgi:yecA family protein